MNIEILQKGLGQSKVNQCIQPNAFMQGQQIIKGIKPKFVNVIELCEEENKLNNFSQKNDFVIPEEMKQESFFILCLNIIDPATSLIKINEASAKLQEFKKTFAINLSILAKKSKLTRKRKKISVEAMADLLRSNEDSNKYMSFEFVMCMAALINAHIYVINISTLELCDYFEEGENKLLFLTDNENNYSLFNGKDIDNKIKEYSTKTKTKKKNTSV